jgi:hypothetical protein
MNAAKDGINQTKSGPKSFRLADGTTRRLSDWADKPPGFAFDPEATLRRCAYTRLPTSRKKSVKTRFKSR